MSLGGPVRRIFPRPPLDLALEGLYLDVDLADVAEPGRPAVFSNFVVSLDGRISVAPRPEAPLAGVPEDLMGRRDWRLYQELAVQSDVVITTGRYVREVAAGTAGPVVTYPDEPDLMEWRRARGLPDLPAFAVVSGSLDFPAEAAASLGPSVLAITGGEGPPEQEARLREAGVEVLDAGAAGRVDGRLLAQALYDAGFRIAFAAAGGALAHLLVVARVLDRLFITQVHRVLGGTTFATFMRGDLLQPPADFSLGLLCFDAEGPGGTSQTFSVYEAVR